MKGRKNLKRLLSIITAAATALSCISALTPVHAENIAAPAFISGYDDGTFRPNNFVTRAEAASMISKLIDADDKKAVSFSDVSPDSWYSEALEKLNAADMLHGYGSEFCGGNNISRAEIAEFIYILKNGYNPAMNREDMSAALIKEGIISGYEDGSYRMENSVTRAEAVALIQRALGISIRSTGVCRFTDVKKDFWAYANILTAAASSASSSDTYPLEIPKDYATKQFDIYNEKQSEWQNIPMINDELRAKGVKIGGEGGQRMNSVAISKDGSFLIAGNDTTSLHRSIDGGKTWEMCNRGYYAISGEAFSIDPNNMDRVLSVAGSHNEECPATGIYLSTDRGYSWKQKVSQLRPGHQLELRESICYDASSYDEKIGGSAVAYWSKNYRLFTGWYPYPDDQIPHYDDPNEKFGLWKTEDGGETWFVVNEQMADSVVKVNPRDGTVYVGNLEGFFRSTDGGKTFEHILKGSIIYSLDVIDTQPDNVYINDYKGVLISTDSGKTFKRIETTSFPPTIDKTNPFKSNINLKVSPVNPDNMVIAHYEGLTSYTASKFYSNDGGKTWAQSAEDESKDWMKLNNRESMFVWSPTDANKVWSFGGDWITSSDNAGASFVWDYEGGSAITSDCRHMFNIYNPDIFYFGAVDFHGGLTTDAGKNWKWVWKFSGVYAGYAMGGYSPDGESIFIWKSPGGFGVAGYELLVSRDAGETWTDTGIRHNRNSTKKWSEMVRQSPTDYNTFFASEYRSTDFGYTWEEMEVDAVYTHNPYGKKEIYGGKGNEIMVSYDNGATWEKYAEVPPAEEWRSQRNLQAHGTEGIEIWDMEYDGVNNIMYYVAGDYFTGRALYKVENGVTTQITDNMVYDPEDLLYPHNFQLVTLDPRYPNVIYVGGYAGATSNPIGVQRSCDGGKTFQVLTTINTDLSIVKTGPSGGNNPYEMLVHPVTGELWVLQQNAGWAKFPPPYDNN